MVPEEFSAQRADDLEPARIDRLADSEHAALEAFAAADLSLPEDHPESFFDEAAVLKGNAMGIIHEGDGSTNVEKVQRLLMLVPALLTVVDEARDTISRLREIEDRLNPGPGGSIRVSEVTGDSAVMDDPDTGPQVDESDNTSRFEQRLYIRAPAQQVEDAIVSGVPGSPGEHEAQDTSWQVIPVGARLAVVAWHRKTAGPADGGRDLTPEPEPGSLTGGWNYRLSAVKTWLETGTPLA